MRVEDIKVGNFARKIYTISSFEIDNRDVNVLFQEPEKYVHVTELPTMLKLFDSNKVRHSTRLDLIEKYGELRETK